MPKKTILTHRWGIYTEYSNVANLLSRVYSVVVPKVEAWEFDPTRPFVLYLMCKDPNLTPSAKVVTTTNKILIPKDAAGGDRAPGWSEVLVGTVGGTRVRLTVTARTTTTITYSETTDTGTNVDAFYIPDVPTLMHLRIEDPLYHIELEKSLLIEDAAILAKPNPYHRNSMLGFTSPIVIPQDFIFSIYIKASWAVAWEDSAATVRPLPIFMHIPIILHSSWAMPETLADDVRRAMLTTI